MSLKPVSFTRAVSPEPRLSKPYVPGKHSSRFWTDGEREIIREHFPKGGCAACLAHLGSHRTPSGVYQVAHKMGLSAPAGTGSDKSTVRSAKIDVPAGFEEALRAFYQNGDGKKRGECNAFADSWKLPRWWVTKRATALCLVMPHRKEPAWTAAEVGLMAKVPLHNPDKCAEIFRDHGFRRSPTSIMVKAKRLGLSRRASREEMSATQAAKLLGIDSKTMTRWILEWGLPATKRADKRLPQQGGSSWDIRPADLRRFIIDHLEHVDLRKVEKFAFVHLISGEDATE